jgi:hypothetical protein
MKVLQHLQQQFIIGISRFQGMSLDFPWGGVDPKYCYSSADKRVITWNTSSDKDLMSGCIDLQSFITNFRNLQKQIMKVSTEQNRAISSDPYIRQTRR